MVAAVPYLNSTGAIMQKKSESLPIDIPGFKGSLLPANLSIVTSIEELIIAERLQSVVPVSEMIRAVDPRSMSGEEYRKSISELAYVHCDLMQKAREVSIEEVFFRLQDVRFMCKAIRSLLVRDDGERPTEEDTMRIFEFVSVHGSDHESCNLKKWFATTGFADINKSEA